MENLLRIKGIDPDEFLNQRPNNNGDDDDENASEYSECSCDECCEEDCCDEKPTAENPAGVKEDASGDQAKSDATLTPSTSKSETQAAGSSGSKNTADEHNKRSGKDRLNVNHFRPRSISVVNRKPSSIVISVEL